MGMGGFHIHSRVGLDTPYMGVEFMDHVKVSVGAAKAKGLLACLYDEDRWPSGAAGGLVVADNPEYKAVYLLLTKREYSSFKLPSPLQGANGQACRSELGSLIARYDLHCGEDSVVTSFTRLDDDQAEGPDTWFVYVEPNPPSEWFNRRSTLLAIKVLETGKPPWGSRSECITLPGSVWQEKQRETILPASVIRAHEPVTRASNVGPQGPISASTYESNPGGLERSEGVLKPSDWVFQGTFARTASLAERKPPLDLVVSSTSVFFRHIHPWFPFLDSHFVLNDLADLREPTLLYYAIFGASIPFLYDSRLNNTQSDSFWKYTKRRIFIETSEEPSYAALEAATLLTLDLSGMANGPQVWSRLAVVARLAAQLRTASGRVLRQSVPGCSGDGRLFATRPSAQHRSKLFWAIYALDSFISITTSQPALLTEHIICIFRSTREATWLHEPSPSSVSPFTSYSSAEPAKYSASATFFKLLQLLDISRSYHDLYLNFILLQGDDESGAIRWLESFHSLSQAANNYLETAGGEELSGRAAGAQRLLSIITDLRVPTSDVEDQFRVDPVLSVPSTSEGSASGADGASSPTKNQRAPPWQTEGVVASEDLPFLNEFTHESLYMSDMWFNTPLFATSGYQQFCEDGDQA
ncbi:hypothetical protein FANTH_6328 [Fusarium anthophilum]|uniref:Xylanolytic transcriptional activator regulatory domain-containing protein n=1 Tax=Fusarium anthophilum TaxID=48485 RepID=A0A8H4ZJU4_9HYPO|nr:hypothetical protein FANTH_6328 [Fusarium anthophilum]